MSEEREVETGAPREAATSQGATTEPARKFVDGRTESVKTPRTPLDCAQVYRRLGLWVTPIRRREKAPFLNDWPTRTLTDEEVQRYFGQDGCNVGVLNGEVSGNLVDVDIDAPEAVLAAAAFLPPTRCIFGRASKRRSHHEYIATGIKTEKLQDFSGEHRTLIEVRSGGSQTVWPSSTHPSGETIEFEEFGKPTTVEADALTKSVGQVAACALIARHWPEQGARHQAALAYAGYLGRNGCDEDLTAKLLLTAAEIAGDDEADDRQRAIEDTFEKLARDKAVSGLPTLAELLDQETADRIAERLQKWLGLTYFDVTIDDIGADGERLTDLGNAKRLAKRHGQKLRFVYAWGAWLVYDGKRWAKDETGEVVRLAHDTLRAVEAEAVLVSDRRKRDELLRHALNSEADHRIRAMVSQARALLPARATDFDRDSFLLNVENGTLDLRTGALQPHRVEDRVTKLAPVEYEAGATHPVLDRFLDETTGGDAQLRTFLQRAAGYSLTGSTAEEKLLFVYGPAASGKSTFIEALKAVLGDYAKTANFDAFLKERVGGGGGREDLARLAGARLVVSSEVDEGKELAEGIVKSFTGGEVVAARFLYQGTFEYRPEFKLWLIANHKPKVSAEDSAMWRRILLVPFERVVPEDRRDPRVKALLSDPREAGRAILAWAVEGALAWRKGGLAIPEAVKKATEAYRTEMDTFACFLSECCEEGADCEVGASDLYEALRAYCRDRRIKALSRRALGDRLKAAGYEKRLDGTTRRTIWTGLRLSPDGQAYGGVTLAA